MKTLAVAGALALACITSALAQDQNVILVPGGAAGPSAVDPEPGWKGPNAVDFAGETGHAAYAQDREECGLQIGVIGHHWDTSGILRMTAQGGVTGAASAAPAAAVPGAGWIAVGVSAVASASGQLFNAVTNNLGFFHNNDEAQIAHCMDRRAQKSGMYTVTD